MSFSSSEENTTKYEEAKTMTIQAPKVKIVKGGVTLSFFKMAKKRQTSRKNLSKVKGVENNNIFLRDERVTLTS